VLIVDAIATKAKVSQAKCTGVAKKRNCFDLNNLMSKYTASIKVATHKIAYLGVLNS